ncbi:4'-phosphopantetheinyl transferase family protein [Thalassospira lucentensis]|uniref:4'-phosphopantetheinyl transferase family protein n=1 Tax=Thalassospira lucentensis TaxID=168935 RepID=UPI00142DD8E9|nr:hypothetical protein [Thalassospira lucentensis]NIZ01705.1 hypothetical protein [Thalassospira lucentensis]
MAENPNTAKQNLPDMQRFSYSNGKVIGAVCVLNDAPVTRKSARHGASVKAHEMLRTLMAEIADGNESTLIKDAQGRPWAEISGGRHGTSISHSRNVVAVALAIKPGIEVGVDLEYCDPTRSIAEMAPLLGMPSDISVADFYDAWCRYEAVFKATGEVDPLAQRDKTEIPSVTLTLPENFASCLVAIDGA